MARSAVVQIIIKATNATKAVFAEVTGGLQTFKAKILSVFSGVSGLLSGLGVTLGAGALVQQILKINIQFQQLQARLVSLTGTAASAKLALDQLLGFADRTPFDLQDTTDAFISLRLAGIEPTMETLERLGDIATTNGTTLNAVADAIRDATSGATRGLKQFGITAVVEGDKIRLTFQGQTTVVENSTIAITNYIERLSKANFAGAMARQAGTLGEAIKDITEAFDRLVRSTGDAGVTGALVRAAQGLSGFIDSLHASEGPWAYFVNLVVVGIESMVKGFGALLRTTFGLGTAIGEDFTAAALQVSIGLLKIADALGSSTAHERLVAAQQELADLTMVHAGTWAEVKDAAGDAGLAVLQFGDAVVNGMDNVSHATGGASGAIKELGQATSTTTGTVVDANKALDERIKLLIEAHGYALTAVDASRALYVIEAQLQAQLLAGNLTLEERIALERQLAAIRATRSTPLPQPAPGQPGTLGPDGKPLPVPLGPGGNVPLNPIPDNPAGPSPIPVDLARQEAEKAERQMAHLTDLADIFGQAWGDAWAAFGEGSISAGEAMLQSLKGALAGIARYEAQHALLEGAEQLALAIAGGPTAGQHFASAAKLFAVGAALSALSGALGGGGAGGSRAGGGAGSAAAQGSADFKKNPSEGIIVIEGGWIDLNDPRQRDAFQDALDTMQRQGRIVVRGSGR